MKRFRVSVHILPRPGLLDPQGKAVTNALHSLGFADVDETRVGRHIVMELKAADEGAAGGAARDMCERLLANPVTEDYEIASVDVL